MGQAFPLAQEKQVGVHCLGLQPARAGVLSAAPQSCTGSWESRCPPPQTTGSKEVAGAKPGWGSGTLLGHSPGTAMRVLTTPATHGRRVVKIERTACMKGGLRGKISAHGAKESCFNWEGKGEECKNHTDIPFLTGLPVTKPVLQGKKMRLWKGI